jgi:uncharacterized protein (DUF2252 family)
MSTPPSSTDNFDVGRAHRKQMRRADHAACPTKDRRIDAISLLERSMQGRIPELVPLKYQRMALSPFGYFRGAVPVMAYDLSLTPNTGLHTQLCGDAHVRNLGAYAAPDGRIVFDLNDFDETIRGPFEWDLKRMATSILLAGREGGANKVTAEKATLAFLARYRQTMHAFTRMALLEVARYQVHRGSALSSIEGILRLAERATPQHSLDTLTQAASTTRAATTQLASPAAQGRIFRTAPPILRRLTGNEARQVLDSLPTYSESLLPERQHLLSLYTPVDVAFKVVGTGSVGLRDYCVYLQGNGPGDPLFLQIKEEPGSAYTPYLGQTPTPHHHGRRVAEGQRAMQLQSDPFLGWTSIDGRDYVVRQLNDHKASIDLGALRSRELIEYANLCGELLARGHARAGDCATLAGYLGISARFDDAVLRFAKAYADQTERDWKALVRFLRAGRTRTKGKKTQRA